MRFVDIGPVLLTILNAGAGGGLFAGFGKEETSRSSFTLARTMVIMAAMRLGLSSSVPRP